MSNEAFFKSPKEKTMVAEEDSDDSDVDPSDFFGLRSNSEVPLSDHQPTVVSDVSYGPTRPPDLHYQVRDIGTSLLFCLSCCIYGWLQCR